MFRLKRMSPQGWASRRKSRSSAASVSPARPVIKARFMRRDVARARNDDQAAAIKAGRGLARAHAPSKPTSVWLHHALAAGALEARAQFLGLIGRERTDLHAIIDALVAEIGTPDHGFVASQHRWILLLQRLERGLRV